MAIELPKETRDRLIASIRRYFEEALEQEGGRRIEGRSAARLCPHRDRAGDL